VNLGFWRKNRRKRKAAIATVSGAVAAFIASPLDDILFWSFAGGTFLSLPWHFSVLLGTIVGLAVFVLLD